jgi:hypothetical protein
MGGTLLTGVEAPSPAGAPSWRTPREGLHVVFLRSTLRKTIKIALVVGTILSLINQGHLIFEGKATTLTWVRVVANYIVPFCVSSTGILTVTRRREA